MGDLICDVITCCVCSCDMGKIDVYDKIMIENQKNRKYGNKKTLYKSPSKISFTNGMRSLLRVKLHLRDGRTDGRRDATRLFVRPFVCHESQRRRHGVTAAIAVDVVAVRVCLSVRPSLTWRSTLKRADARGRALTSITLGLYVRVSVVWGSDSYWRQKVGHAQNI